MKLGIKKQREYIVFKKILVCVLIFGVYDVHSSDQVSAQRREEVRVADLQKIRDNLSNLDIDYIRWVFAINKINVTNTDDTLRDRFALWHYDQLCQAYSLLSRCNPKDARRIQDLSLEAVLREMSWVPGSVMLKIKKGI